MLAHVRAVRDRIVGLGYPTWIGRVVGRAPAQYVVLSAPGWGSPDEAPLGGASGSLDAVVRVMWVAANSEAALTMADRVRDVLSPGPGHRTRLDVADRVAGIAWERAEFVAPDPSVTLTDGTHPTVSVDSYRVQSEPQESP